MFDVIEKYVTELHESKDVKDTLQDVTKRLMKDSKSYTKEQRKEAVTKITDAYLTISNFPPDNHTLYQLGTFLLTDYISDRAKRSKDNFFETDNIKRWRIRNGREIFIDEWNIAKGYTVGTRVTCHNDNDGKIKRIRQPIYVYNT